MIGNQEVVKNEKPQVKAGTKTQGCTRISVNANSTTFAESKAREELNGSKARYEKGMELYKEGKIFVIGSGFKVKGYQVDIEKMTCECPDHKTRHVTCKHLFGVMLFVKNRGKQRIEHLNGHSSNGNGSTETMTKNTTHKPVEAHNKDFDRQATITRLAVINSAIEALKTHRKPIELADILSLASQLEQWALGS